MKNLKFKVRSLKPQGKEHVYFCCHHQDFDQYFDAIASAILSTYDCAVWYNDDPQESIEDIDMLSYMQVFVVPVTERLLCTQNRALTDEIQFAIKSHIPIIPIMLESGLESLFSLKVGSLICVNWNMQINIDQLATQLKPLLSAILVPPKKEGSWIFLSHSSADIDKVRIIRNQFEKNCQNPLAFHLKCLRTDTQDGCAELEGLIKREIDARDWFVFCESEAAKKSQYVNMEKSYVIEKGKKKIWTIDMSLPIEELLKQVDEICAKTKIYISYRKKNHSFVNALHKELLSFDFDVWHDDFLEPGESFHDRMAKEIELVAQFGFFVAILSKGDEESFMANYELPFAIKSNSKVIIIAIGDVDISRFCDISKVRYYKLPCIPNIEDVCLIASLIEAETRRQIKGPMHQADAYTTISKIQERLNYENRYHAQEAVLDHVTGSSEDYLEIYKFPCCGKTVVVGDGPVSRYRADGCCCDKN